MKDNKFFTFANNFTAYFENDICYLEQYGEGREILPNIKTEEEFILLEFALTGNMLSEISKNTAT